MKKSLSSKTFVKVNNPDLIFLDSEEIAKSLGSTDKLNKKKPRTGSTGDVMGVSDGHVLIDFGDFEALMDIEAVEPETRPSEIKFIVRYVKSNTIEEFTSEDEIKARLGKLVAEGHMKIDDEAKVYEISKSKTLTVKLDIFLE